MINPQKIINKILKDKSKDKIKEHTLYKHHNELLAEKGHCPYCGNWLYKRNEGNMIYVQCTNKKCPYLKKKGYEFDDLIPRY